MYNLSRRHKNDNSCNRVFAHLNTHVQVSIAASSKPVLVNYVVCITVY